VEHLATDLAGFVERHRAWAGLLLGLVTFGESLVLVGAFFPATALMLAAGGLAAAGVLDPIEVVLWCVAGAVAGDAASYGIGRHVGPELCRWPQLRPHAAGLEAAQGFFRRYGALSIYLCRFMGPVRAFVPLVAGVAGMPHARFQLANLLSALIWVPVMLAPGYLAASGVGGVLAAADPHALGLAGLLLAPPLLAALLLRRRLRSAWRWFTYADAQRSIG
jgi:membrane protein DedA with SNARE-associated domain